MDVRKTKREWHNLPTPNTLIEKLLKYYYDQRVRIRLSGTDIENLRLILRQELSEPQERVMSIRYGLYDGIGHTLEKTGKMLQRKISPQRVRVIEYHAFWALHEYGSLIRLMPILEGQGVRLEELKDKYDPVMQHRLSQAVQSKIAVTAGNIHQSASDQSTQESGEQPTVASLAREMLPQVIAAMEPVARRDIVDPLRALLRAALQTKE